ncbi:hypothetical protein [Cupriavidus sp. AcVe19-1a]|uniref:hypothetical protein n=1 Tax=Cupriavidus sp. AcVe19-1a TaxID=2821359 RepID=UPI001AE11A91|nr:hypothetical protein [Cupriavidus sp. AcVe19-1a]MBP0629852.1 hypothetical protein [Cupriavidus sp. AcVe19-1a]
MDTLIGTAGERGLWKSTMAAASQALGAAGKMQQAVTQTLKLQRKIRELRDALHHAEAERDVYRELHARTVDELHQAVDRSPAEIRRLRAEAEAMQVRHRAYKLLVQHYMRIGTPIDPAVFAEQRSRVQQHILFQRRKGIPVSKIGVDDIGFLLR